MKRFINHNTISAKHWGTCALIVFGLFLALAPAFAQDEEKKEEDGKKPARAAFESPQLMDEQSVVVSKPKTLEFNLQHRFGTWDNGKSDLWGIYAPANIRMGFSYTPIKNLAVGFGTTKLKMYLDVNAKYALLKQTRDWSMPVSVTLFGNAAWDTRSKDSFPAPPEASGNYVYRMSYFGELLIASRITNKISLQLSPSFTHHNSIDPGYSHDMVAVGFSGRYKFSPQSSFMFNYTQPLTSLNSSGDFKPKPGLTFGFEIATSGHAFQVFTTTYQGILPQQNIAFNTNDSAKNQWLIGFNITRLWGF